MLSLLHILLMSLLTLVSKCLEGSEKKSWQPNASAAVWEPPKAKAAGWNTDAGGLHLQHHKIMQIDECIQPFAYCFCDFSASIHHHPRLERKRAVGGPGG